MIFPQSRVQLQVLVSRPEGAGSCPPPFTYRDNHITPTHFVCDSHGNEFYLVRCFLHRSMQNLMQICSAQSFLRHFPIDQSEAVIHAVTQDPEFPLLLDWPYISYCFYMNMVDTNNLILSAPERSFHRVSIIKGGL